MQNNRNTPFMRLKVGRLIAVLGVAALCAVAGCGKKADDAELNAVPPAAPNAQSVAPTEAKKSQPAQVPTDAVAK